MPKKISFESIGQHRNIVSSKMTEIKKKNFFRQIPFLGKNAFFPPFEAQTSCGGVFIKAVIMG